VKLSLIGAGSTYTPELIDGILKRLEGFPITQVCMMDIDEHRLELVAGFCRRMVAARGSSLRIEATSSLTKALQGADFIVTQIRVAGQKGRHWDILLGKKYGIVGQETTGVGGFSKAMRTIPQIMEICREIERVAPDAWLINFTNPSGIITEAITRYSQVKVVGLCNVPINMHMDIAKLLEVDPEEISLDYVGLNHLAWIRHVYHQGKDVIDLVLNNSLKQPSNVSKTKVSQDFIQALRMIPSPYLKYFYNTPAIIEEQKGAAKTRAEEVMEVEEELLRLYADPTQTDKPAVLSKRGGAYYSHAAVEIMESIYKNSNKVLVVNVPNNGSVDGFGDDDVLEIPAVIGDHPPRPLAIGRVEPEIKGLMSQVKVYERLTVEAAMEKSYRKALLALANNPLVQGVEQARALLAEINSQYQLGLK
jgi:6-phospho-beta-glucosidase